MEITEIMVDMFSANILHLVQQSTSRLFQFTDPESAGAKGEIKFYDRKGKGQARRKEGRNEDVIYSNPDWTRRGIACDDYYESYLEDRLDRLRVIADPDSEDAKTVAMSLGRQMDEVIIEAAMGDALTGRHGAGSVATVPDSQKICAFDGVTIDGLGLNVKTLRAVRKKFKQNEAIQKDAKGKGLEKIVFAMASQQSDDLLGQTEVTSTDYAAVKALVDGEVDTFLGMTFVELELLSFTDADISYDPETGAIDAAGAGTLTSGEGRICLAFTDKRALKSDRKAEIMGRVDEIETKHFAHQIYGAITFGAVRMEEEQLMLVYCKEL